MQITAYKIDVQERKVYPVLLESGNLQSYYEQIGNGCSLIEVAASHVSFGRSYTIWCDEEGRINNSPIGGVELQLPSYTNHITLAGNVLITGFNPDDGSCVDASDLTISEIKSFIQKWITQEESENLQF